MPELDGSGSRFAGVEIKGKKRGGGLLSGDAGAVCRLTWTGARELSSVPSLLASERGERLL